MAAACERTIAQCRLCSYNVTTSGASKIQPLRFDRKESCPNNMRLSNEFRMIGSVVIVLTTGSERERVRRRFLLPKIVHLIVGAAIQRVCPRRTDHCGDQCPID